MLSKSKIKLVKSLEWRKFRDKEGLFVAEGPKVVSELMTKWNPIYVVALESWAEAHSDALSTAKEYDIVSDDMLKRCSLQSSPQDVLALFPLPCREWIAPKATTLSQGQQVPASNPDGFGLCLALDGIQDPGNMGTIVRAADWFGVDRIVCSANTADIYGPKAVQATMGALARVSVSYADLSIVLRDSKKPVYGTFLDGEDIYHRQLSSEGFIVMGNEGRGISPDVERIVSDRLLIPSYPPGRTTSESLNVGVATSIVLAEFRRREQQA